MRKLEDFHNYQHDAVTEFYERSHVMAIMPTGAGKTATSLTAFSELQRDGEVRKGIVVGTKRIISSVWPNEPAKWEHLKHIKVQPLTGTPTQRVARLGDESHDLYAINFNNIKGLADYAKRWKNDDPRLDTLIVDECSFLKNPKSSWAKVLRKFSRRFKNVWLMTGSPRPNSEQDYFNNMAILSKDKLWGKSFYKWRDMCFYPTDYERRNFEPHEFYRREIVKDVAKYSFTVPVGAVPRPASEPIVHEFDLPSAARTHYKTMLRKLFAKLVKEDACDEKIILALNVACSSGKLAQITQGFLYGNDQKENPETLHIHNEKLELFKEFRTGSSGLPTVTFYWFKEDLLRLKKAFPKASVLGAGQSEREATSVVERWNKGWVQDLFLHPASAGHGLNLQEVEAQLMHYCITWSMEQYSQAVARVARQGYKGVYGDLTKLKVLNNMLIARDTVDETKLARVQGKASAEAEAVAEIRALCC